MLQTIGFPAGGRQIDAKASFFRYEAVANANGGDESIRVNADGNDLGLFLPGDAVRLPIEAKRWTITPVNATATGTLRLGVGSVESARLVGNVRVIDQAVDKTRAGSQFIGNISSAANVGNVSVCGIVPKAGTVAVKRLTVSSATAGLVSLYRATGQGTANPDYPNAITNKLVGGTGSVSRVTTGITSAALPAAGEAPGAVFWMSMYIPANLPVEVPITSPILLAGSNVLIVSGVAANRDVLAVFDFEES
jgi:hypothetical protein